MRDQLYERLAPEWRKCLETGAYMEETDESFYSGSDLWRASRITKSPLQIVKAVADRLGVTTSDVLSRRTSREVCRARFMAIRLVREKFPDLTLSGAGEIFNRDCSTINQADRRVMDMARLDRRFAADLADLRRSL